MRGPGRSWRGRAILRGRIVGLALALVLAAAQSVAQGVALFVGDSIGAGFGVPRGQGWVETTAEGLLGRDPPWRLVNASVSGETAKGASRRLQRLLRRHEPQLVILELGGNDALRGVDPAQIRADLQDMARRARGAGARVAIVGVTLPTNFGRRFTREFEAMYRELAQELGAPHMSILDAGAGRSPQYLQPDRIHPNLRAQPLLAQALQKFLRPLLAELDGQAAKAGKPAEQRR